MILSPNKLWRKIFFLSCSRHCDWGLIVLIVYYFQIWNNEKTHTTLLLVELFAVIWLPCILRHPVSVKNWCYQSVTDCKKNPVSTEQDDRNYWKIWQWLKKRRTVTWHKSWNEREKKIMRGWTWWKGLGKLDEENGVLSLVLVLDRGALLWSHFVCMEYFPWQHFRQLPVTKHLMAAIESSHQNWWGHLMRNVGGKKRKMWSWIDEMKEVASCNGERKKERKKERKNYEDMMWWIMWP